MADLGKTFDSTDIPDADPFEVLPDNTLLPAVLDKSEMKATNSGTGHYLSLEFVVIEGKYEGRRFFDRLNLDNPNEQAVKIAERALSALCHATGVLKCSDSDELHGIPVLLKLGIDPAKGDFPARNKIKTYLPIEEKKADAPATASGDGKPAGGKPAAPWASKKA